MALPTLLNPSSSTEPAMLLRRLIWRWLRTVALAWSRLGKNWSASRRRCWRIAVPVLRRSSWCKRRLLTRQHRSAGLRAVVAVNARAGFEVRSSSAAASDLDRAKTSGNGAGSSSAMHWN